MPAATSTRPGLRVISMTRNSASMTDEEAIAVSPVMSRSSIAAISADRRVSRSPRRWPWK